MYVPAPFQTTESRDNHEAQNHVTEASGDKGLKRTVVTGIDDTRSTGQINDSNDPAILEP